MADAPTPIEKAKQFKKIEDPILQRNLMMDAAESKASFHVMGLTGQEAPFKGKVTTRSDGKKDFWVELLPECIEDFNRLIALQIGPAVLKFTLFIKEQPMICFEVPILEVEGSQIHFKSPDRMFFLQRRQTKRYRVPAAYEIWTEFLDPHYQKRVVKQRLFDISLGGLSFLVSSGETRFYTPGLKIEPVHMNLEGNRLLFSLHVRVQGKELIRMGESTGVQVGCQFGKLDPTIERAIEIFIEEGFIKGKTGRQNLE